MTKESRALLLQAYRDAIAAGQDKIADMLEDVILGEMGGDNLPFTFGKPAKTYRDAKSPTRAPWRVMCVDTMESHMRRYGRSERRDEDRIMSRISRGGR